MTSQLPILTRIVATVLVLYGALTLPLGYVLGFTTSSYPRAMAFGLGLAGIVSGTGLLRRWRWAAWPGVLFLMTQVVGVRLEGFEHAPVLWLGYRVRIASAEVGPLEISVNAIGLVLMTTLYVIAEPEPVSTADVASSPSVPPAEPELTSATTTDPEL